MRFFYSIKAGSDLGGGLFFLCFLFDVNHIFILEKYNQQTYFFTVTVLQIFEN